MFMGQLHIVCTLMTWWRRATKLMSTSTWIRTEVQNRSNQIITNWLCFFQKISILFPLKIVWFDLTLPLPTPMEIQVLKILAFDWDGSLSGNVLWPLRGNFISITLNIIYFAGRWDDCIHVVRLHHLCHPKSTIAEQAHRNNLKGFFMVRVRIDTCSTVQLAIFSSYPWYLNKAQCYVLEFWKPET